MSVLLDHQQQPSLFDLPTIVCYPYTFNLFMFLFGLVRFLHYVGFSPFAFFYLSFGVISNYQKGIWYSADTVEPHYSFLLKFIGAAPTRQRETRHSSIKTTHDCFLKKKLWWMRKLVVLRLERCTKIRGFPKQKSGKINKQIMR